MCLEQLFTHKMILISRTSAPHCFASALRQGLPRSTSAVFFSTTRSTRSGCVQESTSRAIAFKEHGDPITALSCYDYILPALAEGEVRVKFELSAVVRLLVLASSFCLAETHHQYYRIQLISYAVLFCFGNIQNQNSDSLIF
jgi:hypothetical protein